MPTKLSITHLPDVLSVLNNSHYCTKNKLIFDLCNDNKSLICNYSNKFKLDPHVLLSLVNEIIVSHHCVSYISINRSEGEKNNVIYITFSL